MKKLFIIFVILLISLPVLNMNITSAASKPSVDWALLVSGSNAMGGIAGEYPTREPLRDCYYMFHVLVNDWGVQRDHIKFLDINPLDAQYVWVPWGTIDGECDDYGDVKSAIDWLKSSSTSNDNVLIFIASHGGGYLPGMPLEYSHGRIDGSENDPKDEELEHIIDGNWEGVDECIVFKDIGDSSKKWYYYDDDFNADLQGLSCKKLTIVLMSCLSGGFIDDLSASNRVIVTSSKETSATQGGLEYLGQFFTPFIGAFIDAFSGDVFHRYHAVWNENDVNNRIVDTYEITVSDYDCNSAISWREAFVYAKDEFPDDSPWFDSNGNGLPTYKNGKDYIEYFLWIGHNYGGYTSPDTGGYEYPDGTHVGVLATATVEDYEFDYWLTDDRHYWRIAHHNFHRENPVYLTMNKDQFVTAYFPDSKTSGGGDGCPTLYTWDGHGYVDYGVIDIHDPSGEDMVKEVSISKQDLAVEDGKVKLRLEEGWLGLNYSESVIDQVKLYVIDEDGKLKQCPLTSAVHSRLGNIREYLASSDDVKAQTLLLETIDLTFKVREDSQGFIFIIEGCNQLKQ